VTKEEGGGKGTLALGGCSQKETKSHKEKGGKIAKVRLLTIELWKGGNEEGNNGRNPMGGRKEG